MNKSGEHIFLVLSLKTKTPCPAFFSLLPVAWRRQLQQDVCYHTESVAVMEQNCLPALGRPFTFEFLCARETKLPLYRFICHSILAYTLIISFALGYYYHYGHFIGNRNLCARSNLTLIHVK